MSIAEKLVLQRQRHLKWQAFDKLEMILMIVCGLTLFGFSVSVTLDIVTRTIGQPWLWLQEVTSTLFIYGIFIGTSVATRRNDHLYLTAFAEAMHGAPRLVAEIVIRLVVLAVAIGLIYFGYVNFLRGFGSFDVHLFCDAGKFLVGALFLVQRLFQQFDRLPISQELGVGPDTAVSGDFIVLNPLRGGDQAHIQDFRLGIFRHQLGALFQQAFHAFASLALGLFLELFEDLFQALHMLLGFEQMAFKRGAQLLGCCRFNHLGQRLDDLVFRGI